MNAAGDRTSERRPDCGEKHALREGGGMRIIWASLRSFKLGFAFGSFIEREQKEVIEPSDAKLYMAYASLKEPAWLTTWGWNVKAGDA